MKLVSKLTSWLRGIDNEEIADWYREKTILSLEIEKDYHSESMKDLDISYRRKKDFHKRCIKELDKRIQAYRHDPAFNLRRAGM